MRAQSLHLTPRRRAEARRGGHPRPVPVRNDVDRARDAGGPLDIAFYGCDCGYQFNAAVSTSVSCPHCGSLQAW